MNPKRVLIVDGVERIGKSTLAKHLLKGQEHEYIAPLQCIREVVKLHNECGYTALKWVIESVMATVPTMIDQSDSRTFLVDRWFVSQFVYQYAFEQLEYIPRALLGHELYLLVGEDRIEFYQELNADPTAAFFNNRLFMHALRSYYKDGYTITIVTDYPLRKGVTLYKIVDSISY